jgi:hypothetical protein
MELKLIFKKNKNKHKIIINNNNKIHTKLLIDKIGNYSYNKNILLINKKKYKY